MYVFWSNKPSAYSRQNSLLSTTIILYLLSGLEKLQYYTTEWAVDIEKIDSLKLDRIW